MELEKGHQCHAEYVMAQEKQSQKRQNQRFGIHGEVCLIYLAKRDNYTNYADIAWDQVKLKKQKKYINLKPVTYAKELARQKY